MSNTGWYSTHDRSTGQNVKIKTSANTDYDIIGRYNQFDTAIVIQVFRNERDIGNRLQTGNIDAEIGSILCRPINKNSAGNIKAYPLNSNINQYPAEGEYVKIGSFGGDTETVFYELISTNGKVSYNGNPGRRLFEIKKDFKNKINDGEVLENTSTEFKVPTQFKLRPHSSDLIFQSRFGSNIRMTDISDDLTTSPTMILSNNVKPEFTGRLEETLNKNGSYIILTSGKDTFDFKSPIYSEFVQSSLLTPSAYEETNTYRYGYLVNRTDGGFLQEQFVTSSNSFSSTFDGDRIIISSNGILTESTGDDTLILSDQNIALFSKKSTSIDALRGMNISTGRSNFRIKSNNVYVNSPNIFLGHEENRSQPAVLGENLLVFLELVIGTLKHHMDLNYIFDDSNYSTPGLPEEHDNMRNALKELIINGRIPEDLRRNILSDKVFISPNRIDPQIDPPARAEYDVLPNSLR